MAFCSACGADLGGEAAFCPKCGKATAADASPAGAPPPVQSATDAVAGMPENVAGMLSYLVGWLSGLFFFFTDKRPSVRFHAMQSIVLFGAITVLDVVFGWTGFFGGLFMGMIINLVGLVALVCWVICMVKAYQGVRFKLPVVGDIAENLAK